MAAFNKSDMFLNEKFKASLSDVVWGFHVFELELQSPDSPPLLMSQSVWATTAFAGEGRVRSARRFCGYRLSAGFP